MSELLGGMGAFQVVMGVSPGFGRFLGGYERFSGGYERFPRFMGDFPVVIGVSPSL